MKYVYQGFISCREYGLFFDEVHATEVSLIKAMKVFYDTLFEKAGYKQEWDDFNQWEDNFTHFELDIKEKLDISIVHNIYEHELKGI